MGASCPLYFIIRRKMKITVTNSSTTLGNLLDASDVALIKQKLAAKDSITIVLYNAQSAQTIYVETLGKAATTTDGYPIPYQ